MHQSLAQAEHPSSGAAGIALTLKLSVPAGRDDMIADEAKDLVVL